MVALRGGVRAGDEQRLVSARAGGEESSELCAGEDALLGAEWMRSLVALEPVEWMGRDVAAATREREDAAEGAEDPLDRPQRKPIGLQLARESDDIVGDWPLNVFDEGQAAAELPTLRALAAADVHNLVFQLGGDVRVIPATVKGLDG